MKEAVAGCVFCAVGDNARPPCKAWKREEKEEGSVAAPDSPPGEYTETRDGKRGGLGHGGQRGGKGENYKRQKGVATRHQKLGRGGLLESDSP